MFICEICLFDWYFPQFCKSYMSKYGYLEVFQRVPATSKYRESTVYTCISVLSDKCLTYLDFFLHILQSVGHLTRKSEVLGSIPGLATYFPFSFR